MQSNQAALLPDWFGHFLICRFSANGLLLVKALSIDRLFTLLVQCSLRSWTGLGILICRLSATAGSGGAISQGPYKKSPHHCDVGSDHFGLWRERIFINLLLEDLRLLKIIPVCCKDKNLLKRSLMCIFFFCSGALWLQFQNKFRRKWRISHLQLACGAGDLDFCVTFLRGDRLPKYGCFFGNFKTALIPPPLSFFGNYIALFSRKFAKYT